MAEVVKIGMGKIEIDGKDFISLALAKKILKRDVNQGTAQRNFESFTMHKCMCYLSVDEVNKKKEFFNTHITIPEASKIVGYNIRFEHVKRFKSYIVVFSKGYISLEDAENEAIRYKCLKEEYEKYIKIEEANNILGLKISQQQRKLLKSYFVESHDAYVSKSEIEELKRFRQDLITLQGIAKDLKCTSAGVEYVADILGIEILRRGSHFYLSMDNSVHKAEADIIIEYINIRNAQKNKIKNAKSGMELLDAYISNIPINVDIKITLSYFRDFVSKRFKERNTKTTVRNCAKALSKAYEILLDVFIKEFSTYSEKGIDTIIDFVCKNQKYRNDAKWEFVSFINYTIRTLGLNRKPYMFSIKDFYEKGDKVTAYTQEQYLELLRLIHHGVKNRKYLIEAINNRTVAMVWLYMYLHYITLWRQADLIEKIPSPNLATLSLNNFNDGKTFLGWLSVEGNIFTDDMGIIATEDVKRKIHALRPDIGKNNMNIVLEVGMFTSPVLGLLLAICEAHRQIVEKQNIVSDLNFKHDSKYMLNKGVKNHKTYKTMFDGKIEKILGEPFLNRRANKSYNDYIHNYSEETGSNFAVHLISVLRGYVDDESEITTIYETRKVDGTIDDVVSTLFNRGSFAFAKLKYLFLIDDSVEKLDRDQQTELINEMSLTPTQAEITVKNTYKEMTSITKLITIMVSQPESIKKVFEELAYGNTFSKHNHVRCLYKAVLNSGISFIEHAQNITFLEYLKENRNNTNCLYPTMDTCIGCSMMISEMYFLYELNDMFWDTISDLKSCDNIFEQYMYSNILMKSYMPILKEAQIALGKEKVNVFIDTVGIYEELFTLRQIGRLNTILVGGKNDSITTIR